MSHFAYNYLMSDIFSSAEQFWDNLLSRNPEQILEAFRSLDNPSRLSVLNHLRDMAAEDGWQPEQRLSARAALDAIEKQA
jgi:hypothetical protein